MPLTDWRHIEADNSQDSLLTDSEFTPCHYCRRDGNTSRASARLLTLTIAVSIATLVELFLLLGQGPLSTLKNYSSSLPRT